MISKFQIESIERVVAILNRLGGDLICGKGTTISQVRLGYYVVDVAETLYKIIHPVLDGDEHERIFGK